MADAVRDNNNVPSLLGVSSSDLTTPTRIAANPTTKALLIDSTSLYSGLDTRYVEKAGSLTQLTIRSHTDLTSIGTNTHAQIDTHIANTSNPHSVTLAQVGGTTNHTALSNIGTNTHAQIDTFIGTTVPATYATLAGTLAQFASTTSLQLKTLISDETGSGALVFGTAPTFTTNISTPLIIGAGAVGITPASGSNLNITLATTGDLAVNTNQLYVDTSAGNVGIGTTAPGAKLEVVGQGLIRSSSDATLRLNRNGVWGGAPSNIQWEVNDVGAIGWQLGMKANTTNNLYLTAGGSTEVMSFLTSGNVGIGTTGPTAYLHIKAGSTVANTAPIKLTSGSLNTTAVAGQYEYNGNHYLTNVALLRVPVGGSLSVNTTADGNIGINEQNLMAFATIANTLNSNGDSLRFRASGTIANSINAKRLRVKFGAATILDTGAAGFPISTAIQWVLEGEVIRTSATAQKCSVNLSTNNASLASYVGYATAAETLSGAVTLKLTGEAITDNDIVNETLTVTFVPAP